MYTAVDDEDDDDDDDDDDVGSDDDGDDAILTWMWKVFIADPRSHVSRCSIVLHLPGELLWAALLSRSNTLAASGMMFAIGLGP